MRLYSAGDHVLVRYTVSKVSAARMGKDGNWYWAGSDIPFTRQDGVEILTDLTPTQSAAIREGDRASKD